MSFLRKNGRQKWVKEVKGRKYVPGYWYTYEERVRKYVSGTSSGDIFGAKPDIERTPDIYIRWNGSDYLQINMDY